LDESQKRVFGWLGREMLMMGHGLHEMGMMGHEAAGMMRHGMGMTHHGPDDDSFDDE
jgi:hypothetical protein